MTSGTTPDCGPHCQDPTPTQHETHCSCSKCHGKPVRFSALNMLLVMIGAVLLFTLGAYGAVHGW